MKKTIRLTESDLTRIVKQIINETEKNKMSPLGKMGRLGVYSAVIATVITNIDVIHVTDKHGNDVNVNVGDTYICKVMTIREKLSSTRMGTRTPYYVITGEDREHNIIEFNYGYDDVNFIEGDTIRVTVGRTMADYFMKGAGEVATFKP